MMDYGVIGSIAFLAACGGYAVGRWVERDPQIRHHAYGKGWAEGFAAGKQAMRWALSPRFRQPPGLKGESPIETLKRQGYKPMAHPDWVYLDESYTFPTEAEESPNGPQ